MGVQYLLAKALKILLNPPAMKNCRIDRTSRVCSKSELSGVTMDRYSYVGSGCFLVNVRIGAFCSIADRVVIGGAMHEMSHVSTSPVFTGGKNVLKKNFSDRKRMKTPETKIENDVWIGMGSYIKAGITVHNGAVIGMGSVVTHDVPPYEIWAGNPARWIRSRFPQEISTGIEKTRWWELENGELAKLAETMDSPDLFLQNTEESRRR